ncbi:fibrinogen-like YCDxxxxGGGW domain-containing protein [Amnibacterium sp. CER49]|uniref:fibrinogen-like YCDxxxxGGGW domain-containing protein n=1 Tax=Amnibacterium sp. CER49 TaxID=3039161 RepID=UPI00244CE2D8|nr:fibrinogen-like YCDxxxxGGGW domain-containing protein [Amnibacterium sp. CER49]MDH2443056.1 fibrinogen-like YCDxxxxGGGW domain-containing protein [Amnibacterium sp. CER49]
MNPLLLPRRAAAAAAAAIALLGTAVVPVAQAASASTPAPDGRTAATAAASCWEIKQGDPNAADGVYWLYTPALGAPQQFYCDETTDGGGWVLLGRGRENWSQSGEGYGAPADVAATVTGPAAFDARELSARTVNGLLDNGAVSALPDGIRIRRAANSAGTSWQEVRLTLASPRTDWSWQFDAYQRVATWSIGGVSGTGGTTKSFGSGSGLGVVQTTMTRTVGYASGFGYGSAVVGSTAPTDYLYQSATSGQYVRPFAQVFLRPKLLSANLLAPIPATGTPASTQAPLPSSLALKTVEGVTGLGVAGTGIENTEVSAFTESNGKVYVGGNFDHVQQNAAGAGRVQQSYLAAFDVTTAQLVPGFAPVFDNQVKALATLPDGRIVAGGDFSTVNGVPENGLVVLDPTTGAVDTTFTGRLINALSTSGGQAVVRALDVQGGWLYVGGSFTHATGGSATAQVYSRGAVRLSVTNGTPDRTWTTEFDGTVVSLDASAAGDRVYFAGYFANDRTTPTLRAAALTTAGAAVIPWTVDFTSASASYQQAVREVGDRVWIGGSEHMIFSYNRADMREASTNLMSNEGGDGQVLGTDGTSVFGGCHCWLAVYEGAHTHVWNQPGTAWTKVSKIEAMGAWNATTGAYQTGFSPSFTSREGAGGWAVFTDSTGVTWMGGDFTAARMGSTTKSWVGGFARFAPNDSTAPTSPTNLKVAAAATGVSASWTGSTDSGGRVAYEVLRDDRVIATTTATSITLPTGPDGAKYFVRAVDPSGNRSASTPAAQVALVVAGQPLPSGTVLVDSGSTWSYWSQATAPDGGWQAPAYDASTWATGTAVLGWGTTGITTQIPAPATGRPLASCFRGSFSIPAGGVPGTGLTITTRADDGIVVSVNGTEVGRANLPTGTITATTYALSAPSTTTAAANPVTFQVPASLLVIGTNVITAQVQSNYKSTPNTSFDLKAVVQ